MKLQLTNSLRCLFLALTLCVVQAYAQQGTVSGMKFQVKSSDGATLTSVTNNPSTLNIPAKVTLDDGKEYPVVAIAVGAIKNKTKMVTINIPEGFKRVPEGAIYYCSKLTTINLPASLEQWDNPVEKCNKFNKYTVASGSQYFAAENGLLYNADKKKLIAVPPAATLTFASAIEEIGDKAFVGTKQTTITIPATVRKIGKMPFYGLKNLTSVSVASGSQYFVVEDGILYDKAKKTLIYVPFSRTTSLQIPATVTEVAAGAAYESKITGVTFPDGLKKIGEQAFAQCIAIGAISLPASLEEIGTDAFNEMSGVTSYTVAAGNKAYSSQDGVLYDANKTVLLRYPRSAKGTVPALPRTLKRIDNVAFANSFVTGNLVVPAGVTEVGQAAFSNCKLSSVVLPEGLTELADNLFSTSKDLQTVVIPSTVTTIGSNAFASCDGLKEVEFRGKNKPTHVLGQLPSLTTGTITLHVRTDANFASNVLGGSVNMVKDLEVVHFDMNSYKYATFHWADKKYAMPAGLRATTLRLNNSKLEGDFGFVGGDVVKAGVALLLNGEATYYAMVETKLAPESNIDVTNNILFGQATESRYDAKKGKVFALTTKNGKQGFFWQKGTDGTYANTKLHRAYIDANVAAGVQGFYLEDDILTAIEDVEIAPAVETPIYDLSGRAVQKPGRGLYIVNGKKVLF